MIKYINVIISSMQTKEDMPYLHVLVYKASIEKREEETKRSAWKQEHNTQGLHTMETEV